MHPLPGNNFLNCIYPYLQEYVTNYMTTSPLISIEPIRYNYVLKCNLSTKQSYHTMNIYISQNIL